jgi:hypothetical protein
MRRSFLPGSTLLLALMLVIFPTGAAGAATIIVDWTGAGDCLTIQQGLNVALDGDTVIVRPGRYSGSGNRDLDFHGEAVTLVSEKGPALTVIDCEGTPDIHRRAFEFEHFEQEDTVISGFTITGGFALVGGAIHGYHQCSPTITGNVITGNTAEYGGGGIYFDWECHAVITDNLITGNRAIRDDQTSIYYPGGGGIFIINSSPHIEGNIITNNSTGRSGGGLCCSNSEFLILSNNLIAGNEAVYDGGGAYFYSSIPVRIDGCTFENNTADRGGGAYLRADETQCLNSIFWDNQAMDGDQAWISDGAEVTFNHCDIEGGSAGMGGPGTSALNQVIDADPLFVQGCDGLFYLSQVAAGQDVDSPCLDAGEPLSVLPDGSTRTDLEADTGVVDLGFHAPAPLAARLALDPALLEFAIAEGGGNPADQRLEIWNGGRTPMSWTAESQAAWLELDTTSGTCTSGQQIPLTVSVDTAGLGHGWHQTTILVDSPDAANAPHPLPVHLYLSGTRIVDAGGGWHYDSLGMALDDCVPGDTVLVAAGTYSGPQNRDLDFSGKDLELVSIDGAAATIIDCEGAGRAFHFQQDESRAAIVSGFTITGGMAEYGGAILCSGNASPTITENRFIGNQAEYAGAVCCEGFSAPLIRENLFLDNSAESSGGGLSAWSFSDPELRGNRFEGNVAGSRGGGASLGGWHSTVVENVFLSNETVQDGGGLYSWTDRTALVSHNRFEDNTCTETTYGTDGGGICGYNLSIENNIIIGNTANNGGGINSSFSSITNNLIADNVAHQRGGGVYTRYSNGLFESNTVSGNRSGTFGGGLFAGSITINNCIFWNNQAPNGHEICSGYSSPHLTVNYSTIDTTPGWISDNYDVTWGDGSLEKNPLFAESTIGPYLLSQVDAGQSATSPCVNAGNPVSSMIKGTTRTDGEPDMGILDMGFHYPAGESPPPNSRLFTGPGPSPGNPPLVRVFPPEQDASHEYEYPAYGASQYGVNVATGDVTGSGTDKVLTGAGPGEMYGPHVRGFQVDGTPLPGLNFLAYGTNKYGVNVAAGDIDGDGFDEIVTGAGPGAVFGPHVRGWNYDGGGAVTPMAGVSYFAYGTPKWGVNVSAGDIDGDGFDEIVTGAGPGEVYGPHVRGWDVDGGVAAAIPGVSFLAYGTNKYGVNVTCGDVDGDGIDEIVTGPGPGAVFGAHVRGWNYDGQALTPMDNLNFFAWAHPLASYGANVFAGVDLNSDGWDELVVGCGPDPNVGTPVKVYLYDGTQVTQWFSLEAFAGMTHGTTVAAGMF